MKAERDKLKRLQRLEKIRAIAKQTAAGEAARAETTFAQLSLLASRTGALAAEYAARTDATTGAELRQLGKFTAGLQGICATTQADAKRAQAIADRRQQELAAAEKRRSAVEERASDQARQLAAKRQYAQMSAQMMGAKRIGTDPA
jgi:hypothetical protein